MKSTIILFLGIVFLSQNLFSHEKKIKEIEVRYIDWYNETFSGGFSLEYFFEHRKYQRFKTISIKDEKTIKLIESEYANIKDTVNLGYCDDFRIVCLIKMDSNNIDTLAYGICSLASLNGILIKPNIVILKTILPFFESSCHEGFLFYIQELEKLYKCP